MLKVRTENLLVIAGVVWVIAGVNVAGIGVASLALMRGLALVLTLAGAVVILAGFGRMFHKMMAKHVRRIRGYADERTSAFRFFDARGYLIMIFMIALGFTLRFFNLVPEWFIAFFYTGLGIALALTGATFLAARFLSRERIAAMHGHRKASAR